MQDYNFPSHLNNDYMTTIQPNEDDLIRHLKAAIEEITIRLESARLSNVNRVDVGCNVYHNSFIVFTHLRVKLESLGLLVSEPNNDGFVISWKRKEKRTKLNFAGGSTVVGSNGTQEVIMDYAAKPEVPLFSFGGSSVFIPAKKADVTSFFSQPLQSEKDYHYNPLQNNI